MKEWSDEELDKLFQQSAEELDPPYEPADWQDLRRRLDQADGVIPGGWLKKTLPWLALGLLLLIGGIGVYYGIGDKEGREKSSVAGTRPTGRPAAQVPDTGHAQAPDFSEREGTLQPKEKNLTGNANSVDSHEPGKPYANADTKDDQDLKELPRNLASVSGVRKQSNRSDQERGEGAILLQETTSSTENRARVPQATPREEVNRPNPQTETPQLIKGLTRQIPAGGISENQSSLRENWHPVAPLAFKGLYQYGNSPAYPMVAYTPPPDSNSGKTSPVSPEIQIPKWSVRLGVSPDLSVVRMSDMMHAMRPGPSASLLVERSINDQWTLQTGIIRSLKNYSAPFSAYHPDKHLYQTTLPVSVNGKCTVFEVPLNVRFDFAHRQKARWFIGAGVSSYKMQKESYIYNYDTYVHNASKGWGGSTGWYLLSHANASVGYERRLSSRLSLVAEPSMRIPLRGVGFGKVNLFTGGVWFSLRYTPVFRK
jgi:hypothetical protein